MWATRRKRLCWGPAKAANPKTTHLRCLTLVPHHHPAAAEAPRSLKPAPRDPQPPHRCLSRVGVAVPAGFPGHHVTPTTWGGPQRKAVPGVGLGTPRRSGERAGRGGNGAEVGEGGGADLGTGRTADRDRAGGGEPRRRRGARRAGSARGRGAGRRQVRARRCGRPERAPRPSPRARAPRAGADRRAERPACLRGSRPPAASCRGASRRRGTSSSRR